MSEVHLYGRARKRVALMWKGGYRCQANIGYVRQARPDSGLDFQVLTGVPHP